MAVRYFFEGVNCSSLSICSHSVRFPYSFWLKLKGMPMTQWNMMKVTILYERTVSVQLISLDTPGMIEKPIFSAAIMTMLVSQEPVING